MLKFQNRLRAARIIFIVHVLQPCMYCVNLSPFAPQWQLPFLAAEIEQNPHVVPSCHFCSCSHERFLLAVVNFNSLSMTINQPILAPRAPRMSPALLHSSLLLLQARANSMIINSVLVLRLANGRTPMSLVTIARNLLVILLVYAQSHQFAPFASPRSKSARSRSHDSEHVPSSSSRQWQQHEQQSVRNIERDEQHDKQHSRLN